MSWKSWSFNNFFGGILLLLFLAVCLFLYSGVLDCKLLVIGVVVCGFFFDYFYFFPRCKSAVSHLIFCFSWIKISSCNPTCCEELVFCRALHVYWVGIKLRHLVRTPHSIQSRWLPKTFFLQLQLSPLLPLKKKSCANRQKYLIYSLVPLNADTRFCGSEESQVVFEVNLRCCWMLTTAWSKLLWYNYSTRIL